MKSSELEKPVLEVRELVVWSGAVAGAANRSRGPWSDQFGAEVFEDPLQSTNGAPSSRTAAVEVVNGEGGGVDLGDNEAKCLRTEEQRRRASSSESSRMTYKRNPYFISVQN